MTCSVAMTRSATPTGRLAACARVRDPMGGTLSSPPVGQIDSGAVMETAVKYRGFPGRRRGTIAEIAVLMSPAAPRRGEPACRSFRHDPPPTIVVAPRFGIVHIGPGAFHRAHQASITSIRCCIPTSAGRFPRCHSRAQVFATRWRHSRVCTRWWNSAPRRARRRRHPRAAGRRDGHGRGVRALDRARYSHRDAYRH